MTVYFLRHGQAGESADWLGPDAERPLTEEGRESMRREADAIAALGLGIELVISSPLLRAFQTAEIVAGALGKIGGLSKDERLGLGFDASKLSSILSDHIDFESILLVCHEPSMGKTISSLIGGGRIECKKGSLAGVKLKEAQATRGDLALLLQPRFLIR